MKRWFNQEPNSIPYEMLPAKTEKLVLAEGFVFLNSLSII